MSNPTGPDQPDETTGEVAVPADQEVTEPSLPAEPAVTAEPTVPIAAESAEPTEVMPAGSEHEATTEIIQSADPDTEQDPDQEQHAERRFTAPSGFDAGSTQVINRPPEPPTEAFTTQKPAEPQTIPPRGDAPKPPGGKRSWSWVIAVVIIVAALAAIAVLGTLLLTRNSTPPVSQEDMVRATIEDFDIAVQNGDLATLRSITCGATRDSYVRYDDKAWVDTHARVAAAKQYPVVASVDQVVVNGDHAEANVTTFMAYAPQTRSTRSFDLQFRDDQWKICQAPTG